MNLIIRYSLLEEIKTIIHILERPSEYENLRSFIKPSFRSIASFALNKNRGTKHTHKVWSKANQDLDRAFRLVGLKDPGTITCYLHGISCEGWFNTDDQSIHVRFPQNGGEKELLNTLVHEILHLATYNKDHDYDQREAIVDEYLAKPPLKKIL